MEFISTSALAIELEVKSSELFEDLKALGWLDRKNDKWVLTELGKQKGHSIPKFLRGWGGSAQLKIML